MALGWKKGKGRGEKRKEEREAQREERTVEGTRMQGQAEWNVMSLPFPKVHLKCHNLLKQASLLSQSGVQELPRHAASYQNIHNFCINLHLLVCKLVQSRGQGIALSFVQTTLLRDKYIFNS